MKLLHTNLTHSEIDFADLVKGRVCWTGWCMWDLPRVLAALHLASFRPVNEPPHTARNVNNKWITGTVANTPYTNRLDIHCQGVLSLCLSAMFT